MMRNKIKVLILVFAFVCLSAGEVLAENSQPAVPTLWKYCLRDGSTEYYWQPNDPAATFYWLRVDAKDYSWKNSCTDLNPLDYCNDSYVSKKYIFSDISIRSRAWVRSCSNARCSDYSEVKGITCNPFSTLLGVAEKTLNWTTTTANPELDPNNLSAVYGNNPSSYYKHEATINVNSGTLLTLNWSWIGAAVVNPFLPGIGTAWVGTEENHTGSNTFTTGPITTSTDYSIHAQGWGDNGRGPQEDRVLHVIVEAVNGTCGTAHNTATATKPTTLAALCTAGTPTYVAGSGPWGWSCLGSGGGATPSCNTITDAVTSSCTGTIPTNGVSWGDTTGLASDTPYTYSTTNTAAKCEYNCNAGYGTATCAATINGVCGSANNTTATTKPTALAALCTAGTPTYVAGSGPWGWSCLGSGGGATPSCNTITDAVTSSCTGTIPTNGVSWGDTTGLASDTPYTYSTTNTAAKCEYNCNAGYGTATCAATINGVCGVANGTPATDAPITPAELCTVGDPTFVLGAGPWGWSCVGSSGGSTSSCSTGTNCDVNNICSTSNISGAETFCSDGITPGEKIPNMQPMLRPLSDPECNATNCGTTPDKICNCIRHDSSNCLYDEPCSDSEKNAVCLGVDLSGAPPCPACIDHPGNWSEVTPE